MAAPSQTVRRDWYEGDDPGVACFLADDAQGVVIPAATFTTGWTISVYDLSADPSAIVRSIDNTTLPASMMVFPTPTAPATTTLDGYWAASGGTNDVGYNIRHYMHNAQTTAGSVALTGFIPGHTYRSVYLIQTGAFTGAAALAGQITFVREGTCLARNG